MIAWHPITSTAQWPELVQSSWVQPLVIFKHSTRCSISSMVYNRLNSSAQPSDDATWVFLDLLQYRDVSNLVADKTGIEHESPQIIVIWQGKTVYSASHTAIQMNDILEKIMSEGIRN
jgi:bacillithiol system protein YtxJ